MKINKLFKAIFWVLFFLHLVPNTSSAGEIPCNGPTDVVQVIVKQDIGVFPTYSYQVKNLSKAPISISAIALGDSEHEEMYSINDNIPKKITSPEGWESGVAYTDESVFMRIFWKTKGSTMIASGHSFGGFKVELPHPLMKKEKKYLLNGKPVEAMDMKTIPFNVLFTDGVCVWGRVVSR